MKPNETIVERHVACPACPSSDAYCIYEDGHGHCFSCGYHTFVKEDFNPLLNQHTYEYLPLRGIEKNTLKFYDIKTKISPDGKPLSVGFQYPDGAYKVRDLDKKQFIWAKDGQYGADTSKTGLFGRDKFDSSSCKSVTITEGELDAASLYQVLRGSSCVVSVQSSGTAVRDCAVDIDWLRTFERVYLAFDNDRPGREALGAVAKLFDYNRVFDVRMDRRKDANEYLQHGESNELTTLWHNAKKYQPENVISRFADFEKILRTEAKRGLRIYPSSILNDRTDGIRTGETVLVTAPEGVGKTELLHHIEFNFLRETANELVASTGLPPAVGAIYLEEPKRRHLEALAGLELGRPVHLPDCRAEPAELISALQKTIGGDERLHLYSHFGSDDPAILVDLIRYLVVGCGCRLVLLDHITMAVSGLEGENERKALDWLSTRLEMLVKELDFALILVSHVNDFGQTRGSRYIGKVCDIRIDMSRDTLAEDPFQRNVVKFVIPKNRPVGKTGPSGELYYNAGTGRYEDHAIFQPPKGIIFETSTAPCGAVEAANDNASNKGVLQTAA